MLRVVLLFSNKLFEIATVPLSSNAKTPPSLPEVLPPIESWPSLSRKIAPPPRYRSASRKLAAATTGQSGKQAKVIAPDSIR